jgi:hypothetical protein
LVKLCDNIFLKYSAFSLLSLAQRPGSIESHSANCGDRITFWPIEIDCWQSIVIRSPGISEFLHFNSPERATHGFPGPGPRDFSFNFTIVPQVASDEEPRNSLSWNNRPAEATTICCTSFVQSSILQTLIWIIAEEIADRSQVQVSWSFRVVLSWEVHSRSCSFHRWIPASNK